jgi:hypothetical protein
MFRKMIIVLPALCLAAPVLAQTDAAPAPAAKPAKAPKPKKVCREQDFTGSRMPQRTCHTEQEWADIDSGKLAHDASSQTRQYGAQ